MKISFVVAELFYADEQTDLKRIVAFRNFANEPTISSISLLLSILCLRSCNTMHTNCLQSSIAAALAIRGKYGRLNAWNYMFGNWKKHKRKMASR
jgi:hypothetical protein